MVSAFMIAKAGTNPLIGRRVSKRSHASPAQQNSRGKSLAVLSNALRKGYVVRMDKIGDDDMFTVRFPRNSYFPEETEVSHIFFYVLGFPLCWQAFASEAFPVDVIAR